jgi:hypothetical protein
LEALRFETNRDSRKAGAVLRDDPPRERGGRKRLGLDGRRGCREEKNERCTSASPCRERSLALTRSG